MPAWDSLGHMRILAAVQAEFGVKLGVRDIVRIEKVSDIKEALRGRGIAGFEG